MPSRLPERKSKIFHFCLRIAQKLFAGWVMVNSSKKEKIFSLSQRPLDAQKQKNTLERQDYCC